MNAELKSLDPIHVVGIDHVGPYSAIGSAFGRLGQAAGMNGWPVQGALGIYYDDPREVPESELRSTACMIVPSGFDARTDGVRSFTIEGGQHAVYRHLGGYDGLGDSWMRFYAEELPKLGMDDAGPPFEIYTKGMMETQNPDELVTDLHIPVKPR